MACTDDDDSVVVGPVDPPTQPPARPDGAQEINPEPGVGNNVRARPFERAELLVDDHAIEIFYTGGILDCYVLDRVEVERIDPATVELTLFEGTRPGAEACIEIAVSYVTTVEVDEPVDEDTPVVDGVDGQTKN